MVEPHQRKVDSDIESSMDLFERAHVGEVAPIEPARPKTVLGVLDGSNQDAAVLGFAKHFRGRFDCAVHLQDAREGDSTNSLVKETAANFEATAVAKREGESFSQILDAVNETRCDLLVAPCPFGRDMENVGSDSAGTVIDVLLARSPVPVLVVRRPYIPEKQPFLRVKFVLIGENEAAPTAAAWAAGLVSASGEVDLQLVLEHEFYENVRELMRAIDPNVEVTHESVAAALEKTHVRLHRGLQKASETAGFSYGMHTLDEHSPASVALNSETDHPLLVLPLERGDHSSEGHVHDRIRHTPNSVLVVPVGAGD